MILKLANFIYRILGTEWCGSPNPPADHETLHFGDIDQDTKKPMLVASVSNDAFELYIGYPSQWQMSMKAKDARRLARFIIWAWWIKGEWFGLRRALWYSALNYKIKKMNKFNREQEKPHA